MALTEKQERFVEEYLVDLNATQAAIRAEYSSKTAYSMGQRLLKNVEVQAAIQQAKQKRSQRTEITQDMVLKELSKIAFANGTDFAKVVCREVPMTTVDEDGNLQTVTKRQQLVEIKDTEMVNPEKRAAISSIKEGKYGIEISSYDKVKALELLGKHLGMFDSRAPQKTEGESNLLEQLVAGTAEDINTDDLQEVE